jgi:hypothetical protein
MSQSTMPSPAREQFDAREPDRAAPARPRPAAVELPPSLDDLKFEEFNYRPVPIVAPVALFAGISSAVALFAVFGVVLALIGSLLGAFALAKVLRARGELGGKVPAAVGLGLSLLFLLSGSALNAYDYATEVPEGYARVNFTRDISKKEFVVVDGVPQIHPEVQALDGEPIFLKGYMYPERQTEGLTRFVLVKDSGECCFGGNPDVTDMVLVEMQEGKSVNYLPGRVSVAGVFRAQQPQQAGVLQTVYKLEGTHFSRSRTGF